MRSIEIAQRAILKVCIFKPILFPTISLYQICDVLTVRQLFILNIILKQHLKIPYDPHAQKRRNRNVSMERTTCKTKFSERFFEFLGPFLYYKINNKLNIYPLPISNCKQKVSDFLQKLSYEETEQLLNVVQ